LGADFKDLNNFNSFEKLICLILPGSILFAIIHLLLAIPKINSYLNKFFKRK